MNFNITELIPLLPEVFLLAMLSFILIVDVMLKDSQRAITYVLTLATLAGCAWLTFSGHQPDLLDILSRVQRPTALIYLEAILGTL